jgi:hypothetical protein
MSVLQKIDTKELVEYLSTRKHVLVSISSIRSITENQIETRLVFYPCDEQGNFIKTKLGEPVYYLFVEPDLDRSQAV